MIRRLPAWSKFSIENKRRIHGRQLARSWSGDKPAVTVEASFKAAGIRSYRIVRQISRSRRQVEQRYDGYAAMLPTAFRLESVRITEHAEAPTGCGRPPVPGRSRRQW